MENDNNEITNIHSGQVIAKNTLFNLIGQMVPLFVGIFTIPVLVRELGTDRFGVLTLVWMVIGYFGMFDLGLGRALTQIIATSPGKENQENLAGLVWTALAIMASMGITGMVIAGSLSSFLVCEIFRMPDQMRIETVHAFYILSVSIPLVILSSGFTGILTAYQRFDLINTVRIPLGLANFVFPLLVLPFSTSLVHITLVLAASRIVSCFAQFRLCLHVMPLLRTKNRFSARALKPLLSFGGWLTVSNIVGPLMIYLDRFVIGTVISVTAVAYYATPYEMVTKLGIVSGALISPLFPAFAAYKDEDASRTVQLLAKSIAAIGIFIFPIVLVLVTFSQEILVIWLGDDFARNSATVLQLLATGVFINCLSQVVFALIQGRGRPDITAKIHLVELLLYLPLLWWSLKYYGIIGAAFLWTSRVAVDGVLLLWVTQRLIPDARNPVIKLSISVIMASMLMMICGFSNSIVLRSTFFAVTIGILAAFSLLYWKKIPGYCAQ